MRSQNSFLIISLLIASYSYGQVPATVQASDKFVLENGTAYTHTEVVNTDWGGSHGIFFGSKFNYTGSGSLWDNGNMIYSNNAGSYNFGAFSLGYIANGGTFGFYDGGLSTGINQPISWQSVMAFERGGQVGIGTESPDAKLHVNGDVRVNTYLRAGTMPSSPNGQFKVLGQQGVGAVEPTTNRTAYLYADAGYYGSSAYDYTTNTPLPFSLNFDNTDTYINRNGGGVAIGSTNIPSGYKLSVAGNVIAQKIKVQQQPWPDFVFEPDYSLPTLKEVASFIKINKHLPGIPSAKEIEKDGLDIGGGQANLLKKIEELTLYAIDQDKRLEEFTVNEKKLQQKLDQQQQELEIMKKQIQELLNNPKKSQ
ncbi:MAG TPA: hypothetical protein VHN59_07225 [Chitinophagaceae bacterium]|nr:hypothetical protein [Chitinophagaceae bacterium]